MEELVLNCNSMIIGAPRISKVLGAVSVNRKSEAHGQQLFNSNLRSLIATMLDKFSRRRLE